MRSFRLLCALLLTFTAAQAAGQDSRYNLGTHILEIPCLAFYEGDQALRGEDGELLAYRASMKSSFFRFDLTSIRTLDQASEDCSGRYDVGTGVFRDRVRIRDGAFNLVLERNPDNSFSQLAFSFREPADTSLWRVSNGIREWYLGGALHILHYSGYPLPGAFEIAYAQADTLVLELAELGNGEGIGIEEYVNAATAAGNRPLRQVLAPETYDELDFYMQTRGLLIDVFENWHVRFLADLLAGAELESLGYSQPGVALYYGRRAFFDGKPVIGLETLEAQYAMLRGLDFGREEALIGGLLDLIYTGMLEVQARAANAAWRSGELAWFLEHEVLPLRAASPEDYESFLAGRSRAWLARLESFFQTPEVEMVLVSQAHLAGPDGLLALLEESGYTVEVFRSLPWP